MLSSQKTASSLADSKPGAAFSPAPSTTRRFALSFAPVLALVGASCAAYASPNWEKTVWQGEPAWASSQGSVQAIVSEARSRLIYLGSADGSFNLLNAPSPQVRQTADNPSPNQGGHRFWLGPQSQWIWPPPSEWEYSAAESVTAHGDVLVLRQRRSRPEYPAITREYAWEGERLRCTARWTDNGQRYFGLHVVAVDAPLELTAKLAKSNTVPAGAVVAQMVKPEGPLQLPHPSIQIHDAHATVRSGIQTLKLGFVPQALTVDRNHGWKLSVQPGPSVSATAEAPDQGYLSQVWVGDKAQSLAELEQLTPYVKGDATGQCSSTIYVEATPPPQ